MPVVVARVARSYDSSAAARESRSRWFFKCIRYRIHNSSFASFSFSFFCLLRCVDVPSVPTFIYAVIVSVCYLFRAAAAAIFYLFIFLLLLTL